MPIEFHETKMGRQFYDGTMPAIARALDDIAKMLTKRDVMLCGMDGVDELVDRMGHFAVAHGWTVISSTFAPEDDGDIVLRFRIQRRKP